MLEIRHFKKENSQSFTLLILMINQKVVIFILCFDSLFVYIQEASKQFDGRYPKLLTGSQRVI